MKQLLTRTLASSRVMEELGWKKRKKKKKPGGKVLVIGQDEQESE